MTPVAELSVGSGSLADPLVPTLASTTVVVNAAPRDGTAYYSALESAADIDKHKLDSLHQYRGKHRPRIHSHRQHAQRKHHSECPDVRLHLRIPAFLLSCYGLTPTPFEDSGAIVLSDAETGDPKYVIPAPYMFDADGNYSYDVFYTLEETHETDVYRLTVTADKGWINTIGRSFPVTVAPSIYTADISADSYVSEEFPELMGGYSTYLSIGGGASAYIRIAMPTIPESSVIDSATLYVSMDNPLSNTTLLSTLTK